MPARVPPSPPRRRLLAGALAGLLPLPAMSATAPPTAADTAATDHDPYLWLEEVQGERALAWVQARNAESRALLQRHPRFAATRERLRAILDAQDRIPHVTRHGPHLYNFWRDAAHPRGLWRRTTLDGYRQAAPDWQTLLDLDALAAAEGENWVWAGATALAPDYRRALVQLSRGGADATVLREFDLAARRFVPAAAGGFVLPEAKTDVAWMDADTLYVGSDFGPGSLTDSGYPRQLRRWRRGTPLAAAEPVFEGRPDDVAVGVAVDRTPGFERTVFSRALDFYRSERHWLAGDGGLRRIAVPADAELGFWRGHALLQLRSDWQPAGARWAAGTLLAADADALLAARDEAGLPPLQALFTPSATRALAGWSGTRGRLLLNILDNVAGRLEAWQPDADVPGGWQGRPLTTPQPGTLHAEALHDAAAHASDADAAADPLAEAYLLRYTDFTTPDALLLGRANRDTLAPLKSRGAQFDARGVRVEQRFARSRDGTRVPYFVVWPAGARSDGDHPTLLYGYGGFEVSQQPWYAAAFGSAWTAHGGVLVVANIRGGGEFGPAWHQAAVKANKQTSYDDFAAVAEDLIATGVTRPARLGIQGGSNGGLLVGAVMLQRPELFGAVVCQVPLLDMRRYHRLLAGASWMAEYGNPDDPAEWAWIARYSPYQNLRAGQPLPPVLFTTSTRDDRVHPGHARKMAARMAALGHAPLYVENTEGGHAGAADNAQQADMMALEFAFLWQRLGEPGARP